MMHQFTDAELAAHDADVKAEALEEFAAKVRGELAETALVVSLGDDYLHGMNSALGQCIDRAAELRAAEVGNLSTRGGV